MRTLAELIRWRAQRHPDLDAIWYEGKTQTYDQKKYQKDPNRYGDQNPKLLPGDEVEVPGD